ncbi:hypothetical protein HELRODRAFT_182609 [Helobdella robusta]|uniref:Uncharacterized protein n=1 Tax=Helobdella robusta TaxID=6412 RepID=T1FIH0_HELRO|nr:hypothetical protein HELRODRAFT_182609 [Helobdella robusta]ESN90782.1 hypothetical protein HELRODRAFT_182609 [Helobdella robusta]
MEAQSFGEMCQLIQIRYYPDQLQYKQHFFATTETNSQRMKTNVEYGRTDKKYNAQQNTKKVKDNSLPYCEICRKNNHRADNCYFRNYNKPPTRNTHTTRKLPMQYKPANKFFFAEIQQGNCKLELFTAFVNQRKCTTLRDSGTTTLLVHQDCVEPHSYTGEYENIKDYKALVLDQPLNGIGLVIGNITDVKNCTRSDVIQWQNNHEVNRSMATTRAQSRREKDLKN